MRQACDACGTRAEDWEHDRFAFIGYSWQCPGCEVIEQEHENTDKDKRRGVHVGLIPREYADIAFAQEHLDDGQTRTVTEEVDQPEVRPSRRSSGEGEEEREEEALNP